MAVTIIVFGILIIIAGIVVGAYLIDKRLHSIDKEKYYDKSLKKQLKKGNISDYEYENKNKMIRP